jgi:hypothetical protein
MPQFDIISFFSQLFCVFLAFITLYLLFSFYLLPALAAILKIRKRKLAQIGVSTTNDVITTSSVLTDSTNSLVTNFNTKLSNIDNSFSQKNTLNSKLSVFSLKVETSRQFNLSILSKTQLVSFFFA